MDEHYGIKPMSFFAHLLEGYEGDGGLAMMQLKEKVGLPLFRPVVAQVAVS